MKFLQVIGSLIPILLIAFSYYLFGNIEPDTPSSAGAALAMLLFVVALFAVGFVLLFVLPSSFMLLHKENRDYFSFNSRGWLSVLAINWVFILAYVLCIFVFMVNSGG